MVRLILSFIAVAGLALAIAAVAVAPKTEAGVVGALVFGAVPLLIGTVALGAAGIMERVDLARTELVAAIREGNQLAQGQLKQAKRVAAGVKEVTCARCAKVVPISSTIESKNGPICNQGCERAPGAVGSST